MYPLGDRAAPIHCLISDDPEENPTLYKWVIFQVPGGVVANQTRTRNSCLQMP